MTAWANSISTRTSIVEHYLTFLVPAFSVVEVSRLHHPRKLLALPGSKVNVLIALKPNLLNVLVVYLVVLRWVGG